MDGGWWRATLPTGLTLCSGQACAETTVLEEVGVWRAYITVGDGGVSLCGISQFPGPSALMIKVDHHAAYLHMGTISWNVPDAARMTVSFSFDGRYAWR